MSTKYWEVQFALQFADVAMPVGAVLTVQRDGKGDVRSLKIDSWRTRGLEFVRVGALRSK
ncbi:MAG: hypothetical protein R3E65_02835 [Steroidobacteraceae bacterium]